MCDATLLTQIYYYRWKRARRGAPLLVAEDSRLSALYDEASPLLPGDGRPEEPRPRQAAWKETLKFTTALLFVFVVGVAAWVVDRHLHKDAPRSKPEEVIEWRGQILGWLSAALFRECVRCISKSDELILAHSRIADSANRCVALILDGAQGLKAAARSQELRDQVRRAVAFPLCLFYFGEYHVYVVHPRGIGRHQASRGERALDRGCVSFSVKFYVERIADPCDNVVRVVVQGVRSPCSWMYL